MPSAIWPTVLILISLLGCTKSAEYVPQAGDVLLQDLNSSQGQAVKLASGSEYTHCGILFEVDGEFMVYEAVGPVRAVPLTVWIEQGVEGRVTVMRLDTLYGHLTPEVLLQMRAISEVHLGKAYDWAFSWTDEKLYCSELVWKTYSEGMGLELTSLRELRDYDLTHPAVREKLFERYGDSIPLEEPMVAPGDLFSSKVLRTVYQK